MKKTVPTLLGLVVLLFVGSCGSKTDAEPGKTPLSSSAGRTWETIPSPTTADLNAIFGFGSNQVYAVGTAGTVLKYDGTDWSAMSSGTNWTLYDVYGRTADDVYAVGDFRSIFRKMDNGWTRVHSQLTQFPLYAFGGPDPDLRGKLVGVGKNKTIWAFFVPQYYNVVIGNGSNFSSQEQHEHSNDFYGAWTLPSGDVVVTGSKGVLGYVAADDAFGHRSIDVWPSPVSSTLRGIWGVDADNLYAVGDGGVVLRRHKGGNWTIMPSNTTSDLRAIFGTSMNDVYAVGANGTVMHYDGSAWSPIPVPTSVQLNDIWGASANDIYAVGNGGVILHTIRRQACSCPDGTTSVQVRKADEPGWEACQCTHYSVWCDPTTGICFQDPQKDAYVDHDPGIASQDAVRYCSGVTIAGYDDWRVPTIAELRSLIRGNPSTEPSGECPLTEGSTFEEGQDAACLGAADGQGPGNEGCYWPPELSGSCHRPDPGTQGVHSLEYWAVEPASNRPDWIASVLFDIAGVCFNHINSYGEVRCVRDSPTVPVTCVEPQTCTPGETRKCTRAQVGDDSKTASGAQSCEASGSCFGPCSFTGFTPTPRPEDVCPQCDQLTLTIRVPERLTTGPAQLMAFFYEAGSWTFPPQGPPDGGTDYNLVQNPAIDLDRPYTMVVPGCTYYREKCLAGQYQVYVGVYYSSDWPPLPADGDYVWGKDQPPITLGSGPQQDLHLDVTLQKCENGSCDLATCPNPAFPYQCPSNGECVADISKCCPADKPARCADGSCAATAAQCPSCGSGNPIPNDDTVWGCRFSNSYSANSCADFPECEGWPNDPAAIVSACLGTGNGAANCVCTRGNSCQVERAMVSGSTRCTFVTDGKKWYAFGMPSIGCTFGGGSGFINSPICAEYCQ